MVLHLTARSIPLLRRCGFRQQVSLGFGNSEPFEEVTEGLHLAFLLRARAESVAIFQAPI